MIIDLGYHWDGKKIFLYLLKEVLEITWLLLIASLSGPILIIFCPCQYTWLTPTNSPMLLRLYWFDSSPRRYVLKIHIFIESGLKIIQFKTKSGIFIKKNIHSIESKIFNRIIHSQKMEKIIQNSKMKPKYGFGPSWGPCIDNRPPEMDWNRSH